MPRSIRFYVRNRWLESAVNISTGADTENYQAANTKTIALDESWRSPQTGSTYVAADLGQSRKIGAVCLVKCNLTHQGTYRIRVSNSSSLSPALYDSGTKNRPRYYSDSEIAVAKTSEFFSAGIPFPVTRSRLQRQVIIEELPSEVTGRYVHIDFADSTNPDGYIEVGLVYAGRILQPANDLMFGWKLQRDAILRNGQASCGQYWPSEVRQRTLIDFTLAPQTEATVLGHWFLLQTLLGTTDPFIVSLTDRTNSLKFTTSIYGKWVQTPVIQATAYRAYSIPMQVEEIVG